MAVEYHCAVALVELKSFLLCSAVQCSAVQCSAVEHRSWHSVICESEGRGGGGQGDISNHYRKPEILIIIIPYLCVFVTGLGDQPSLDQTVHISAEDKPH